MHNLKGVVRRHKAGLAASVVLVGGLAGGVLLTPGTAFASTAVDTSTSISGVTPTHHFNGTTTLTVSVTVAAASGTAAPTGTVSVSDGSESCSLTLAQIGASASSNGSCNLGGLSAGSYNLDAAYAGVTNVFNTSATATPTKYSIGTAPAFTVDSPATSAHNGDSYTYNFNANGAPTPTYALSGAPGWLSVNTNNGVVSGNVPNGINSFTYSVVASNSIGTATAGPFTVSVTRHGFPGGNGNGKLSTSLHCTSPVHSGTRGTCTLDVTNTGWNSAQNVKGQINLPSSLTADFCGHAWGWGWGNWGCTISGNTASENLGTLRPGQSRTLTVTFTAESTHWFWGWGHQFSEWVKVTGSASSSSGYFWAPGWFGGSSSYSSTWVKILPPHFKW
jgi:hypothetical protein